MNWLSLLGLEGLAARWRANLIEGAIAAEDRMDLARLEWADLKQRLQQLLVLTILMAGLTFLLWKVVNAPNIEPPWPSKIQGFSFSPFRAGQSPSEQVYPSVEEIDRDLAILAGDVHAIRSYSVESTLAEIPRLAAARGLAVWR